MHSVKGIISALNISKEHSIYRILGNLRVAKILWSGVACKNILTALSKKHGAGTQALARFRRGYEHAVVPVESQWFVLSLNQA